MIRMSVSGGGLDSLVRDLDDLDRKARDLAPLARRVASTLEAGNRAGAVAGVDKDGRAYEPIKDVTYALTKAFTGHDRAGGPPLASKGAGSRIVTDFTTSVVQIGVGHLLVVGEWPNLPWLQYHQDGYTSRWGNPVPQRDPVGARPVTWEAIGDEVDRFLEFVMAGVGS